jgi:hypothetical protein
VGNLLGRCSVQCARKATLQNLPGRLIKIYGERGIALEKQQIKLPMLDSWRSI